MRREFNAARCCERRWVGFPTAFEFALLLDEGDALEIEKRKIKWGRHG
jgi:hypothetical protein